ncbi:MAG: hypothetical protein MZW92_51120 [Comamonadaceae bacterium]|nr:hypothetical protein [Comamonadaceae bacterium]
MPALAALEDGRRDRAQPVGAAARRERFSVEALAELSETLFAAGVLPYYLHVLDRVRGAAALRSGRRTARASCTRELRARLPGYLVPRLVREQPGRAGQAATVAFPRSHGVVAETGSQPAPDPD